MGVERHGVKTGARATKVLHVMEKQEQASNGDTPISPHSAGRPTGYVKRASTTNAGEDSPPKRQKFSPGATSPSNEQQQPSRKGRACVACRKLKVKCDAWERGLAGCSRCQRLGIECINARRLRIAVEGEEGYEHITAHNQTQKLADSTSVARIPSSRKSKEHSKMS